MATSVRVGSAWIAWILAPAIGARVTASTTVPVVDVSPPADLGRRVHVRRVDGERDLTIHCTEDEPPIVILALTGLKGQVWTYTVPADHPVGPLCRGDADVVVAGRYAPQIERTAGSGGPADRAAGLR